MDETAQLTVITGDENSSNWLSTALTKSLKTAKKIDVIVSFLMESGVYMLLEKLKEIVKRDIPVRILTGNYLNITEPSALYLVKSVLGDKVDLRFYNDSTRSFHPKSYIFEQDNYTEVYIGSSNLSRSALTSGIEWNYRLDSRVDSTGVTKFQKTFEDLFNNHSIQIDDKVLENYSKNWHRPKLYRELEKIEELSPIPLFSPRGFQIEALIALENSRNEGADKALIQAATGVGKTFLAAFDSKEFSRILYIAHRNEILNQAKETFQKVIKDKTFGFFNGETKNTDADIVFASVNTLGRNEYLNENYFIPDSFDYIIIDEFHHAAASQYQNIINYFKPKFLLGLTATPERLDRKDIFKITDYNVPYRIDLFEAINKGLLVPFRYYGIYDDTDYDQAVFRNNKYQEESLNNLYIGNLKRNKLILDHYRKHNPKRTLAFCSSRKHADAMAKYFNDNGVPSAAVYSGPINSTVMNREIALEKLRNEEIKVIFCVDIFNEGLDVPEIDCVLFLRPTESPVIFFQQLGRGLRKNKNKDYLTVLDFLGNYKNVTKIPSFLSKNNGKLSSASNLAELTLPDDCFIDFDLELIDLFKQIEKSQKSRKDLIDEEYYRIKEELGHRPSRVELFTEMDSNLFDLTKKLKSQDNPFKNYLCYLSSLNELSKDERKVLNTIGFEFIKLLETTNMTRVYKMPVLMAFLGENSLVKQPDSKILLSNWKTFFEKNQNYQDLSYVSSYNDFLKIDDKTHLSKIKSMPVKFLIKSGKGFFDRTEDGLIRLSNKLDPILNSEFIFNQVKDIIEYRTLEYYQRRYYKQND